MTVLFVVGIVVGFLLVFAARFSGLVIVSTERHLKENGNADVPVPLVWLPGSLYAVGTTMVIACIVALAANF